MLRRRTLAIAAVFLLCLLPGLAAESPSLDYLVRTLDEAGQELGTRQDGVFTASLSYTYRGPVRVTAGYAFTLDGSNSYGQSSQRHRLSAAAAVMLPWRLVLSATGALQLTSFPQGVQVAPSVLLVEDTENTDELALKLSRSWASGFDVELQGATYQSVFATSGINFSRTLVQADVGWRF